MRPATGPRASPARAQRPAVVVVDVHLPVLDGYGFLDAFRAMPGCAAVPAIVITGSREVGAARQGLVARGVIMQIAKPFELGTLLAAVRGAARPRQRGAA